jgi:hypothetical protein
VRLDALLDVAELLHQVLVHVEAPGGVDDHHVAALALGLVHGPDGDLARVAVGALLVDGRAGLGADLHELVHRGGPVDVAGRERDVLAVLLQKARELPAGGRLPRALEARHQDHGRGRRRKRHLARGLPHQRRQLLVHDLHDLLARVEALHHLVPERAFLHGVGELLDDAEVDVRLEQREADLAHRLADVVLVQLAARADVGEGRLELVGEKVEHRVATG